MHIKIYFDEKPLFLCDTADPAIERSKNLRTSNGNHLSGNQKW